MKWVALAIVVFIGGYTFVTLYFRKPGRGYEPFQSARERETVQRAEAAGYRRIEVSAERPAEPNRTAAALKGRLAKIQNLPGGLPAELREVVSNSSSLPQDLGAIQAPRTANTLLPCTIQFVCTLPDKKNALTDTWAFLKGGELAIITGFEPLDGGLLARSKETAVLLTIPAGALKPGSYRVTLYGAHSSRQWTLQVN